MNALSFRLHEIAKKQWFLCVKKIMRERQRERERERCFSRMCECPCLCVVCQLGACFSVRIAAHSPQPAWLCTSQSGRTSLYLCMAVRHNPLYALPRHGPASQPDSCPYLCTALRHTQFMPLPLHGPASHCSISSPRPGQRRPPLCGGGLSHRLFLRRRPC